MHVQFSEFVESDLDVIAEYIAADNPNRAVTFVQEIGAELQRIGTDPFLYQVRQEIGEGVRLATVGRYVILFRVEGDQVFVERVVHGNRLLPPLLQ